MDTAAPGEVVVSSTAKDLVAGSGLRFVDRGTHDLRGVPGEWRLFAVEALAAGRTRAARGAVPGQALRSAIHLVAWESLELRAGSRKAVPHSPAAAHR